MKRALRVATVAFGVAAAVPAAAEMPNYDVDAYCQRVAAAVGGSEDARQGCLEDEQQAYNTLKPAWDGLTPTTRNYCDRVARAVGQSFDALKGCVEQEQQATTANKQFKFQR